MEEMNFNVLGLDEKVLRAIDAMGFTEPSPIQKLAIPAILEGADVIGQAQTGTGKTLAYGASVISQLGGPADGGARMLVLVPTRELAIQVSAELAKLGRFSQLRCLAVYGGEPIERQIRALRRGVDIVAGTPGRILDHIRRGTVDFSQVSHFVLDEADEMLDMGFIDDINAILASLGPQRQTLLFSATMPASIRALAEKHMRPGYRQIATVKSTLTVELTAQYYYDIHPRERLDALCRILDVEQPACALIFCRTKKDVDALTGELQARGYGAAGLHGDMSQGQRLATLRRFREGGIACLAATDVAARGIDIEQISHVINYELPEDPESYVHRIGRTGRANRTGTALSLVAPAEHALLRQVEAVAHCRIARRTLPTAQEVAGVKYRKILEKTREILEKGGAAEYSGFAQETGAYDPADVAAALLRQLLERETGKLSVDSPAAAGEEVRLFLSAGKMDRIERADIFRFLLDNANIAREQVGEIRMMDKFSFVNVAGEALEAVLACCAGKKLGGRTVRIQRANASEGARQGHGPKRRRPAARRYGGLTAHEQRF
jgi:ATP-dependent RNA helicase DeaD